MPVTSDMSRSTKTKTPTIQPAHSRTEGVTTLRSSSMVWRVKRPMAMNGLVIVFIPETMRRAGMESPSPAREQQGRGYGKSPLHARGRAPIGVAIGQGHGITPACAGKSAVAGEQIGRVDGITPACAGKNVAMERGTEMPKELPPHARGRAGLSTPPRRNNGITPACAGKSRLERSQYAQNQNHPRMRGEESVARVFTMASRESPPHARGRE